MNEEYYYRIHVFICTNRRPDDDPRGCCWAKGSVRLRNYMKVRTKQMGLSGIRINIAGCLDRCEEGPTMVIYPEGCWYSVRSEEDIDLIMKNHVIGGKGVEVLRIPSRRDLDIE